MTSQAMFMVKIILFDEDNATVEGNDLLLDIQMEIRLSSESCLFCKSQFTSQENTSPPGKCSTLPCVHRSAVNFLRILKVPDQPIFRDSLQFGTGVQQ